jgi:secreted trypsin-like serine protease
MRKVTRKPLIGLATLAALAVLAGAFPGLASSAPAPSDAQTSSEEPEIDARAAFELERSSRISKALDGASELVETPREINVDALLTGLEASATVTQRTRQQLIESLASIGYRAERLQKFKSKQLQKTAVDPNLRIPRIINGQQIPITTTPWQVALVNANSKNVFADQFCGGSIIGATWILTAAHCVDVLSPKQLAVVSGVSTLPRTAAAKGTSSAVKSIIIHPLWINPYWSDNPEQSALYDVALVELSTPLKFGPNVTSIRLPQDPPSLTSAYVSGWGLTENDEYIPQLKGGATTIVECPEGYYAPESGATIVCAGSSDTSDVTRVDSCYGDSGGPLTQASNGSRVLIGVVSFGPECPPGGIGAYANVHNFRSWIMCHAAITNPFGGPHFCGDEAGYVTVSDTLKISKGTWGGTSASIQWFADDVAIRGATKNSLPLSGLLGKFISVRISTNVSGEPVWFYAAEYYDPDLESYFYTPVEYATNITAYLSGDFVPCTSFVPYDQTYQPPSSGSCSGTNGQRNGELKSNAGRAKGKFWVEEEGEGGATYWEEGDMDKQFWAYRDITLPRNTFAWTWGVTNAWSRGVYQLSEFDDGFYELFGSRYYGFITPNQLDNTFTHFYQWDAYSTFEISVEAAFKRTQDPDTTPCYSPLSGPIAPLAMYFPETDETACVTGFSETNTINKGKGRIIMGTYGNESLGTRFTFDVGIVVALHN